MATKLPVNAVDEPTAERIARDAFRRMDRPSNGRRIALRSIVLDHVEPPRPFAHVALAQQGVQPDICRCYVFTVEVERVTD